MNNRGSTSDPAVIAADTAGVVPPELSLAWLGESRDRPALAIIVATGLLTSLVVASRLASSTLFLRRLTLDDRLAVVSLTLLLLLTAITIRLLTLGASRHLEYLQYVMPPSTLSRLPRLNLAAQFLQMACLLAARISGLGYFHRAINTTTSSSSSISTPRPSSHSHNLDNTPLPSPPTFPIKVGYLGVFVSALISGLVLASSSASAGMGLGIGEGPLTAGISLVCSVLVFAVPAEMVWLGLRGEGEGLGRGGEKGEDGRKRVELRGVVVLGGLATGLSALRLSLARQSVWAIDPSWEYAPMLVVQVAEAGMTLAAVSLPGAKLFWDGWLRGTRRGKRFGRE